MQFYTPFGFDAGPLGAMLAAANRDVYQGIWWDCELVAFWMLRGYDSGAAIGEFGVMVDEDFSGYGIGQLCVAMAKTTAKLLGFGKIYLTCYPENARAMDIYNRNGFHQTNTGRNGLVYMEHTL